jgi:hypothetical protein
LIVHTAPAGALGTDVAWVQVSPASAVERNVPTRCGGELGLVPLTSVGLPETLKRQWVASPQTKRLAEGLGIPVGTGIDEAVQWAPPSVVRMNWARAPPTVPEGTSTMAQVWTVGHEKDNMLQPCSPVIGGSGAVCSQFSPPLVVR